MSEHKKERATVIAPRRLPMPDYDYQVTTQGSYTIRYDDQDAEKKRRERKAEKVPELQNLKFAL